MLSHCRNVEKLLPSSDPHFSPAGTIIKSTAEVIQPPVRVAKLNEVGDLDYAQLIENSEEYEFNHNLDIGLYAIESKDTIERPIALNLINLG